MWVTVAAFAAKHGKLLLELGLAIALIVGLHVWLDRRDAAAYARGAAAVEARVKDAQARADAAEREREQAFQLTTAVIDKRTDAQATKLSVTLDPLSKALNNAIQADTSARCRVAGGVLDNLEAQRAAVNTGIATSNPVEPR